MIDGLKPYLEYKESGLSWLGQVPKHWEIRPAFGAFQPNHERNYGLKEKTVLSLSYGRIVVKPSEKLHGLVPESFETYQIVNPGYIIIRTTDLQNDHTSLRIGMVKDRGIITSAYLALKTIGGVHSDFGYQFLNVWDTSKAIYGYGSGLRQNLDFPHFKRMPVALPPSEEQAAIVRFLNHANGRIEKTIRAKKKLIALLNEQKQAIIHRAVTRGLDPSVPLKPSGIPWLGDIPKHWEVISLRIRYSVELGKMLDAKRITGRHSIPYLRNRDVQWDRVLTDDLPVMDIPPSEFARYTVKRGDLLVCEGGQVGRSAFWEEQLPVCGFQKALHRVRCLDGSRDHSRFFFYQMQLAAGRGVFSADGNENTFAHLTCEKLRRHRFAFPPFTEQNAIADHLDGELRQFQLAISRLEREIELLREYRTRLVADVVTGKVDVREADASLPDEAPPESEIATLEDSEDLDAEDTSEEDAA